MFRIALTVSALLLSMTYAHAEGRRALVWKDALPAAPASDPAHLVKLLEHAGLPADAIDSAALAGRLDPTRLSLLVMPYGPYYPAPAREALLAYLKRGGALLTLGGQPLTQPLVPVGEGWVPAAGLAQPTAGDPLPVADWESAPADLALAAEPAGAFQWRTVRQGRGHALEATAPNLAGYAYVALRGFTGRADRPILRFRARGDANVRLLCAEAIEEDGSRWKAVFAVGGEWRTLRVHAAQFRAYASPERFGAGDHFHPERVAQVRFGFTRTMVGSGRRVFWLDDVAWEPGARVEEIAGLVPLVRAERPLEDAHFGRDLAPQTASTLPFFEMAPATGATFAATADHALAPATGAAPMRGPLVRAHAEEPQRAGGTAVPLRSVGRIIPLLRARDRRGGEIGPAMSLLVHSRGAFAGMRWAFSGVAQPDLYPAGDRAADEAFVRLSRALAEGPLLGVVEPEFAVEEGRAVLRVIADVVGASTAAQVRARVLPLDIEMARGTRGAALAPATQGLRQSAILNPQSATVAEATAPAAKKTVVLTVPLEEIDPLAYRVEVELFAAGQVVDRGGFTVDALAAARALADEFLRRQKPDGTYSGTAFVDNRGTRTVLAVYALTGDRRYLQSALRWGEVTLARQRPDGGYRMGYGISSVGESCFVADGGEIACGIARLALDAPERDRPRYRHSLRRYMAFRESFRCPGGGIGVGYSQTDFGVRPTVHLDEIRRIYAPELNPYTIGCTLASASAHAALLGSAVERSQAVHDARWLLAHLGTSPSGATIESLCWAHHLIADPALRVDVEEALRDRLLARLCGSPTAWWLGSDGRHALNLDGLVYAANTFAPEPAVQAELARAVYAFSGEGSPWSVFRVRAVPQWTMADWIYLCYAGVGLVDAVRPGITLPPPAPESGSKP